MQSPLEGIGDLGSLIAPIEPIDDPDVGIGRDFTSPSSTMLVIFAAMGTRPPPPFHFFQITTGMPAKRLFARDPTRVWYHRGVPGFGDSIDAVAGSLRKLIDEQRAERVIALGSSAGGYAASSRSRSRARPGGCSATTSSWSSPSGTPRRES